ncbi:MAG: MFS transporter [Bryobacteraceae bacterium]|nr:MFS transporter [Bryobacteraceae bacterium]
MNGFWSLVARNRNYRYLWSGQVISEIGDHFNSIAVLSLAYDVSGSGAVVGGVMIARTLPAILAAPFAGVALDRMDRRKIMIASDLVRAVIAILFVLVLTHRQHWLLYLLSGLLTFASPFFSSGRSAVLPRIAAPEELHTANAVTQTTGWLTLTFGTMLGGLSTMQFGYKWAFVANALSFVFSAFAVWKLKSESGFRAAREEVETHETHRSHFWADFSESLTWIRQTPLVLAILLAGVGWSTGGGAAQILFTLFGSSVYGRGAAGIGLIWGFAGVGLVIGGVIGHQMGRRLSYGQYLHAVWINFLIHGLSYVAFSQVGLVGGICFIALSRIAMGANNVQNRTMLLTHIPDALRGRVFSTSEAMNNATMMVSMSVASLATIRHDPREIGLVAGLFSTLTALPWAWAAFAGILPEPRRQVAAETTEDIGLAAG